ncbi:MAG: hypothetical protein R3D29_04195 [Nitratireductor sp.]
MKLKGGKSVVVRKRRRGKPSMSGFASRSPGSQKLGMVTLAALASRAGRNGEPINIDIAVTRHARREISSMPF